MTHISVIVFPSFNPFSLEAESYPNLTNGMARHGGAYSIAFR